MASRHPLGLEPPIIKVQCKRTTSSVGGPTVQGLIGTLAQGGGELGLLVTLGGFSKDALAIGRTRQDIRLLGGPELISLLYEHYERMPSQWRLLLPLRRVYVIDHGVEG